MSGARFFLLLAFAVCLVAAGPAGAAVLKVTTTDDGIDANLGDSACVTAAGACSLRAAVQTANALAGADQIILPAGIYALTLATFQEDAASSGDLDVAPGELVVTGAGAATTIVDGKLFDRVFDVLPGASLNASGLTIRNGRAGDGFGGGGVLNRGSLALTYVAVTGSRSSTGGGGIFNNAASATLANVTLSGNSAISHGGAIWNFGGQASLTNVTISGNIAGSTAGAVRNDGTSGAVSLTNVTVAGNSSNTINAALVNNGGAGGITVRSSILSGAPGESCFGPIASAGFNIDNGGSCKLGGPGDKPGTDPLLAPLAENGGPVPTQALLQGSPAIDAGDPGGCPGSDARNVPRPQGAGCDVGAFEYTPPRSFKRAVTFKLFEHLVASGKVSIAAGGPASCLAVRVTIQRKAGGGWRNAGTATASPTGAYEVKLQDRPGQYRAVVAQAPAGQDTCLAATSRTRKHGHKK